MLIHFISVSKDIGDYFFPLMKLAKKECLYFKTEPSVLGLTIDANYDFCDITIGETTITILSLSGYTITILS